MFSESPQAPEPGNGTVVCVTTPRGRARSGNGGNRAAETLL